MNSKYLNEMERKIYNLIQFREKHDLNIYVKPGRNGYDAVLKQPFQGIPGLDPVDKDEIESRTNCSFEDVCYYMSLIDLSTCYDMFHMDQNVKNLKENVPLIIFSAKWLARLLDEYCERKQRCSINIDGLAKNIFDELSDLEGIKVDNDTREKIRRIIANPVFLPVLSRELEKHNLVIVSSSYINEYGKKSYSEIQSKHVKMYLSLARPMHLEKHISLER